MMFQLDLQSRVPIYEQMKRKVAELVLLGVLQPHEHLPSVRTLARELGVNPNTVQKAYQEMEREGIVYSISGKGSFIADTAAHSEPMQQRLLEELRESAQAARLSGVSKQQAWQCIQEVYGEEESE